MLFPERFNIIEQTKKTNVRERKTVNVKAPENEEDLTMYSLDEVKAVDREVAAAIEAEMSRQNSHIELIASENWVSKAVMAAMGSPLTNKYAEGYPGKRYYGGCECVDEVERLAIERAKKLFGCEYVNVQPLSLIHISNV